MNSPTLKRVIRLDNMPMNETYFTSEGYLRDKPILTRVGIFEYTNSDGSIRRELRLPEEVFDPESLASYKGKPIICTHDAGLIDKDNVSDEGIGTILSEGIKDGDNVRADIVIHDTDILKETKMRELSLGYSLDLDEEPGEWNGKHYDAIQRNIRINHLALVGEARAGDKARLNIDGRDSEKSLKGGKGMKNSHTARTDGILSAEELEQAIAEYKANRKNSATPAQDGEEGKPIMSTPPVMKQPMKEPVVKPVEKKEDEDEDKPVSPMDTNEAIEEKVAAIKDKHEDEDPDLQKLYDIIDSLLAERQFKAADCKSMDGEDEEDVFEKDCIVKDSEDETEVKKPAFMEDEDDFELTDKKKKNKAPFIDEDDADEDIPDTNEEEAANLDDDDEDIPVKTPEEVDDDKPLNTDSVDAIVRARIQVGMMGRALNMDGLESMKLRDARKAIIKAVRPSMNLDGKSNAFVRAAYEMACDEIRSRRQKDTRYQKRQMFNGLRKDSADNSGSANAARERMIARQQNRNNKED